MKCTRVAALGVAASLIASSARAAVFVAPAPYDTGNGSLSAPQVTVGICGYQTDGITARPCNPGEAPPGSGSAAATTTPASSTYTASSTANTPTQVAAADTTRKDLAIVYPASATGVLTIYENAGAQASYYLQPGQTYRATSNGLVYQGVIYASSTVASDTAAVTVYH